MSTDLLSNSRNWANLQKRRYPETFKATEIINQSNSKRAREDYSRKAPQNGLESSPSSSSCTSVICSSPSASPFASDRLSCSSNHSLSDENSSNILVTTVNNLCQQIETFNGSLIDFPCLGSDEIDRLLGSVNDFEHHSLAQLPLQVHPRNAQSDKAKSDRSFRDPAELQNDSDIYDEFNYPSFQDSSEEILLTNSSLDEIIAPSNTQTDKKFHCVNKKPFLDLNYDSESTITGSETEMCQAELAKKRTEIKKRFSKRVPKKPKYLEDSLNLSESDENSDEETTLKNSYLFGCCTDYLKTSTNTNDKSGTLKPWWPKAFFLDGTKEQTSESEASMFLSLKKYRRKKSAEDLKSIMKNEHKFLTFINRIWKKRRQRKQLELWQFILKRLDAPLGSQPSTQAPFKWVDRNTGVFRIIDTRLAAEEWGRYRNNSRMDYEKMARAMRFYYKHSILRKARQQLHFQFAMPFVEWFQLQQYLQKT